MHLKKLQIAFGVTLLLINSVSTEAMSTLRPFRVALVIGDQWQDPMSSIIAIENASIDFHQIAMLLKSELRAQGHMGYMNIFFFLLSLMMSKKQIRQMAREREMSRKAAAREIPGMNGALQATLADRRAHRMRAEIRYTTSFAARRRIQRGADSCLRRITPTDVGPFEWSS